MGGKRRERPKPPKTARVKKEVPPKVPPSLKRTLIACAVCGKEVWKPNAWLKRTQIPTCSYSCGGKLRGKELVKHSHKGRAAWTEETLLSYRIKMSGANNPAWKGGVTFKRDKGNYIGPKYVRCPVEYLPMARKDGYVMEHRLIIAKQAGRVLERTEVVHHRDHDTRNNDLSNLELWPDNTTHKQAEHGRFVESAANRLSLKD
jgi:hypothetical protein